LEWRSLANQDSSVLYEDLVCANTVDEHVLAALISKKEMSEYIMDFAVVYSEVKE